jgi:hypothetical protein
MTLTVTPQPANSPPRFRLTIASPDGSAITAVVVTRVDPSGAAATRVQPAAGPSPLTLDDYEAPWDAAVVYNVAITYGTGATTTFNSGYVTLSPQAAWAIHPTAPALSVCLDQQSFAVMGVVSLSASTRAALTTKHRILGAEYQIVTKTGPRAAPAFTMQVATVTSNERTAVLALVRDQTPILIQVPAVFGWDWENGYFDVGDVGIERFLQYGPEPRRTITLPLERVESPIGTQSAPWTWTGAMAASATWDALRAGYAKWSDVLTNTRR